MRWYFFQWRLGNTGKKSRKNPECFFAREVEPTTFRFTSSDALPLSYWRSYPAKEHYRGMLKSPLKIVYHLISSTGSTITTLVVREIKLPVTGKRQTKIYVLPKIEETRLIWAHFFPFSSRYQETSRKKETSWNTRNFMLLWQAVAHSFAFAVSR